MLDIIYQEERPWGSFRRFCQNMTSTVKIIIVKPNSLLSLQYHNHRSEFWRIIKGSGIVVKNEDLIPAREGDEFFIPQGVTHRLETLDDEMIVLEISFGHFDENDIIRLSYKYGRQ